MKPYLKNTRAGDIALVESLPRMCKVLGLTASNEKKNLKCSFYNGFRFICISRKLLCKKLTLRQP
jgi:hypothetical protein